MLRLLLTIALSLLVTIAVAAPKTLPKRHNDMQLRQQLSATIAAAEHYQGQMQQRLIALSEQNTQLQKRLDHLQHKLTNLSQQMTQPNLPAISRSFWRRIIDNPRSDFRLAVGLITLGVLLLLWLLWYRRPRLLAEETYPEEHREDDEYDFMGSEEAIPAKLDLARAYVEMDNITAAKETLEEVLKRGSPAQQDEAQAILKNRIRY